MDYGIILLTFSSSYEFLWLLLASVFKIIGSFSLFSFYIGPFRWFTIFILLWKPEVRLLFAWNKFTVNVPCVKYPVNKILFLTKASNFIFLYSVTSISEVLTCEFNLKGVFRASDEILSFRWKLQEGLIWYNLLGCCYYTFLLGQSCRGTQIGSVIDL